MRRSSFKFRGLTVLVTYSLTNEWRAMWIAACIFDGETLRCVDGVTRFKRDDLFLEDRIARAVCVKLSSRLGLD